MCVLHNLSYRLDAEVPTRYRQLEHNYRSTYTDKSSTGCFSNRSDKMMVSRGEVPADGRLCVGTEEPGPPQVTSSRPPWPPRLPVASIALRFGVTRTRTPVQTGCPGLWSPQVPWSLPGGPRGQAASAGPREGQAGTLWGREASWGGPTAGPPGGPGGSGGGQPRCPGTERLPVLSPGPRTTAGPSLHLSAAAVREGPWAGAPRFPGQDPGL